MHRLLFIETSTALCSTALAEDGRIISTRRSSEPRAHASLTAVYVKEMLDEAVGKLSNAKKIHDGLEQYYAAAMDFDRLNEAGERLITEIFAEN